MYGEQNTKDESAAVMNSMPHISTVCLMIDSTAQIYVQCNNTCLHSKPDTTKGLPPRAILISGRRQRKWNDPAHLCLCYQLSMMCLCAIPAVVVITSWWQCQPLGQPAAALAM